MIENIIEPKKLFFIWKDNQGNKYTVGELQRTNNEADLIYHFGTEEFKNAKQSQFEGYTSFPLINQKWQNVMSTFTRRITSRKRADFNEWLNTYKIANNTNISDFALLGYSGASLPSDNFMFLHPFEIENENFEFVTEVAGVRHRNNLDLSILSEDDKVEFILENENINDPNAIMIHCNKMHIGYMNRCFAKRFREILLKRNIEAFIDRINGTKDVPRLLLFVKVR